MADVQRVTGAWASRVAPGIEIHDLPQAPQSTMDESTGGRKVVARLLEPRIIRQHLRDGKHALSSVDVNRQHAVDAGEVAGGQGVAGSNPVVPTGCRAVPQLQGCRPDLRLC